MKKDLRPVHFPIIRETEKAVYCEMRSDWARNTDRIWIPKSVCVITKRDDDVCYMNSVTEVAEWFLIKNHIR